MAEIEWLAVKIHNQNVKMYSKGENNSKRIMIDQPGKRVLVERLKYKWGPAWRPTTKQRIKRKISKNKEQHNPVNLDIIQQLNICLYLLAWRYFILLY